MKVVFGGSFNPPTIAHQAIVVYLSKRFEEVILIPNADDYQKNNLVSYSHREKMVKLMTEDLKNVVVSDLENRRGFKGTVETLRELNHPYFACGEDCLEQFSLWIHPLDLLKENNFLIFTRQSSIKMIESKISNDPLLNPFRDHFNIVQIDFPNVSSSEFRRKYDQKIVNSKVFQYIVENKLYKE